MSAVLPQEHAVLNHLMVWLREEVDQQVRRKRALTDLCKAMSQPDPQGCEAVLERVHQEESRSRARETKMRTIFQALGKLWGVSPKVLTLRSIAERSGSLGAEILELREALESIVREVGMEAKKVSATARIHRSVILEVLNTLFDSAAGDPMEEQGRLLDAEA